MQSISRADAPIYSVTSHENSNSDSYQEASGATSSAAQPEAREGGGEAAALKLDTRILEGNPFISHAPTQIPRSDPAYKNRPINYPIYDEPTHFRVKVQDFTSGGYEAVISSVNLQRFSDRAAAGNPRGARTERKGDDEAMERSRRRSKRTVRLKVKEMGADHLMTFTTRETIPIEAVLRAWSKLCDNVAYHLPERKWTYVCVPERHPTNPDHIHLHVAIRGRLAARELVIFRRCWYVALGGKSTDKGAEVKGGLNIRQIKVRGGINRRMDKIASYISKYITKDSAAAFNKKRYWCSKINLQEARAYWLKARTITEALMEFIQDFNFQPTDLKQDFFQARNIDLIWLRSCPDKENPSPVPF